MTAFLRAFLSCNKCHELFDTSTVPSARNVSGARRDARRAGWVHKRDGCDLCEYCASAGPKEADA